MTDAGSDQIFYMDLMACAICVEPCKEPKCLPCIHTFCLGCLETYGKDSRTGDELTCPLCRQVFRIPSGGFEKLPNNFFVKQMLEKSKAISCKTKCEMGLCGKGDTFATRYCSECDQNMCDSCFEIHGKMKVAKLHKVVLLEQKTSTQDLTKRTSESTTNCSKHEDKPAEFYCYDCNQAVCGRCNTREHKTHTRDNLQASSEQFKDQLKDGCKKLRHNVALNRIILGFLDESRTTFLEHISATERKIADRSAEVKRLVEADSEQLLDHLESAKKVRIKEITARREELERQVTAVDSLTKYVEEMVGRGSACAITLSAKDLLARMEQLQMSESCKTTVSQDQIFFDVANLYDALNNSESLELIGRITIKTDGGSRVISSNRAKLECSLSQAQEEVTRLNRDLLNLQTIERLSHEATELKSIQSQLQMDNASVESKLADVEQEKIELEALMVKVDAEKIDMESIQLKLKGEACSLRQQLQSHVLEITKFKDLLAKSKQETKSFETKLFLSSQDTSRLRGELNTTNQKATDLEQSLQGELNSTYQQLTSVADQLEEAKTDIKNLMEHLQKSSKQTSIVKEQLLKAENEIKAFKLYFNESRTELATLKHQLQEANRKSEMLKIQLMKAKEQGLILDALIARAVEEKVRFQELLTEADKAKQILQDTLTTAKNEIKETAKVLHITTIFLLVVIVATLLSTPWRATDRALPKIFTVVAPVALLLFTRLSFVKKLLAVTAASGLFFWFMTIGPNYY